MALPVSRFTLLGSTEHAHEREALEFVRTNLPEVDPFYALGLCDLQDPSTGGLYEIDLLVIGYSAIYLVEIKSHPGRMEGDDQGWIWTPPGADRQVFLSNPLRLTNHKCKVLRTLLDRKLARHGVRAPFVQPLIFLSAVDLENKLSQAGRAAVVGRDNLVRALKFGEFPGADQSRPKRPIDRPMMRAIKLAFDELGLKPRKEQLQVGDFVLGPVVEDGGTYQDRIATHAHFEHMQHRARVYLVPEQTSVEHRQRLKRAAEREVQLLWSVRDHPNILSTTNFAPNTRVGPTLVFEDFDHALRLDRFLQRHTELSFEHKLDILRQIGHALHYCHRRNVVHGGLSPQAVLVRLGEDKKIDTRLFNFQFGGGEEASATVHRSSLDAAPSGAYQAPELAADPTAITPAITPASDTFSLGALAYFLFTGQPPATSTTELLVRLRRDGYLDPAMVADDLPDPVVNLVIEATRLSLDDRFNDAADWVELLAGELQRAVPSPPQSTAHVLEANENDILADRFTVRRVLGHGASARVLQVSDEKADEREFALKVARGEDHDARVRREGEQLRGLRHARIVQCHEILEIDGRTCLLLSLAGSYSLQNRIAAEGSLDLELSGRYGEDLLEALKALEDEGILHRDIKPANLGVGSTPQKLAKHLTLFDFSLAAAPLEDLEVGTAAYRDPFLPLRGRWDAHADRWSAAVSLHEMLTGVRPRYGRQGSSPLDPEAELVLAAERFDAAVRDRLTEFFAQALAREPASRFESAIAMARAWSACLSPQLAASASASTSTGRAPAASMDEPEDDDVLERRGPRVELGSVTDEEIAAIERSTQLRALPLSSRALNALDRAGLTIAEELLALPNNRLSAIRGIGNKVAREILDVRDRWRAHLGESQLAAAAAFVPDFTGPEHYVETLGFDEPVAVALMDAGLRTSTALARAPSSQVEAITRRVHADPQAIREALAQLRPTETESSAPTTVDGWLAQILTAGQATGGTAAGHLGLLLGLDARVPAGVAEVANAKHLDRRKLEKTWAEAIEGWRAAGWAADLRDLCLESLARLGGVATLGEATLALRAALGHDLDAPTEQLDAQLSALLRVAAELGPDEEGHRLQLRRTEREHVDPVTGDRAKSEPIWTLSADETLWTAVKRLGELADELAKRVPLAASGETERVLADVVAGSDLAADKIGKQRLVQLAAAASRGAAPSSRLELYPVGMEAGRALELSAQALTGTMTEEILRTRVKARYPEAKPLPSRTAGLDDLLHTTLGLRWDDNARAYARPEQTGMTSLVSEPSAPRYPTAVAGQQPSRSEEAMRAKDFDDTLRAVVQERKLRVWGVNPSLHQRALAALEQALGVRAVALDQRLIAKMESYLASKGGRSDALDRSDAAGPEGPGWSRLVTVAEQAARELASELFPATQPLLLTQAGLLARYGLKDFVAELVAASHDDASAAIVLLNPAPTGNRPDVLNGSLPITGLLPGQVGELSTDWIQNRHRAATNHPA